MSWLTDATACRTDALMLVGGPAVRDEIQAKLTRDCWNGWKMAGTIGFSLSPENMLPTTPTMVSHGCLLRESPMRMRFPIGFWLLKNLETNSRFTIATGSSPGRSLIVKARPSTTGVLSVLKKSDVTDSQRALG